jgi:hypothetical protein
MNAYEFFYDLSFSDYLKECYILYFDRETTGGHVYPRNIEIASNVASNVDNKEGIFIFHEKPEDGLMRLNSVCGIFRPVIDNTGVKGDYIFLDTIWGKIMREIMDLGYLRPYGIPHFSLNGDFISYTLRGVYFSNESVY